jgi:hypothetical protein
MPAHTKILPKSLQPSCANLPALGFASGAAIHIAGLDRFFGGFGAPPAVHWALGGVGADYYCRGTLSPDQSMAMAAAAGYAGGFVATMFVGR